MSETALDTLITGEEALIAALDGHDVAAIEAAARRFGDAVSAVAASGSWRDTPEVQLRIARALQLAEAGRVRCAYLADRTRRRLERIAAMQGETAGLAYGRDGRVQRYGTR